VPTQVVVHVAGEVRHPGLVELAAGSRVADAVEAAGGATRRAVTSSVNLARPLVDGEQVVVLGRGDGPVVAAPGPPGAGVPGGGTSAGGTSGPVNLNTASLEQLDALPGIGPVLAQRILEWRSANGRFTTVEELGEVSGIGDATLADLRPAVTV
jgi:competence protein ComEA